MNKKSESTLKKFERILRVKNYSENTIRVYCNFAYKFINNFELDIYHITVKKAKEFLLNQEYSSTSSQNQYINAVKLLYKYIVGLKLDKITFERPRKEQKLPQILDKEELLSKIYSIKNKKHKCALALTYSVGLRRSEVINLKLSDLSSSRMEIRIRQAKGKKDRIVPLTKNMLNIIADYYRKDKPKEYLFNGQNSLKYSYTSLDKIVKRYIGKKYSMHSLRHCAAVHLLESGTDIRYIQELLSHESIKTTQRYTRLTTKNLQNLPFAI